MAKRADGPTASRARTLFYLAYFADIKPGEIASLRTSAITVIAKDPLPVWRVTLATRPLRKREIVLLPPVQQALERYLETRGMMSGIESAQPDCPLIASTRAEHEGRPTLSRQTLHTIGKRVFERASALALAASDLLAARRLSQGSLQWLNHAFEVHTAHQEPAGHWAWLLLGSTLLTPESLHSLLPARIPLQIDKILQGFAQLQVMWRHERAKSDERVATN